jgi:apolipoprotein N-acyltransferase
MNGSWSYFKEMIETERSRPIKSLALAGCVVAGAASFLLSFEYSTLAPLILVYMACLVEMTRAATSRQAFYSGVALGLCIFVPKVLFFWLLFGWVSTALWLVLAFWHGIFVLLGRMARKHFPPIPGLLLLPFLWTGLEYFRSELYYLRFSWLTPGFVFGRGESGLIVHLLGVYGIGFVLMMLAVAAATLKFRWRVFGSAAAVVLVLVISHLRMPVLSEPFFTVEIAGLQLEFPASLEVPAKLDELKTKYPDASIYVLSEYTFDGPIPARVLDWCRKNQKYLIAGGKAAAAGTNYYNTVFVAGPNGEIVFEQAKAVPIQFFADGLPAEKQAVWQSPWGKIGLCICYDLSYTRVVDALIRKEAQALIVPTMDVADWGAAQHQLHARIAPIRAAEYGVPIFRLASSGISQVVNAKGSVEASAPYPGQGESLHGFVEMRRPGRLPVDRVFAPICVLISAIAAGLLAVLAYQNAPVRKPANPSQSTSIDKS